MQITPQGTCIRTYKNSEITGKKNDKMNKTFEQILHGKVIYGQHINSSTDITLPIRKMRIKTTMT